MFYGKLKTKDQSTRHTVLSKNFTERTSAPCLTKYKLDNIAVTSISSYTVRFTNKQYNDYFKET